MTEWLSKFFLSKVTAKNAATILLCIVGLFISWPWLHHLALDRNIPPDYVFPLFVLGTLALSYLMVSATVELLQFLKAIWHKRSYRLEALEQQEDFKGRVRASLPLLEVDALNLLRRLQKTDDKVDIRSKGVVWLLEEKWIRKITRMSASEFVARIDPCVKKLLGEFEASEFTKNIQKISNSLKEQHFQFLRIFWDEDIPYGTPKAGNMMPNPTYSAGHFLVDKKLIHLARVTEAGVSEETFTLQAEAKDYLRNHIFKESPRRETVTINTKFVEASFASGGGAKGSRI